MNRSKFVLCLTVLAMVLPAQAHAAATTYQAPFPDMTSHGSCSSWSQVLSSPVCHGTSDVDAESGRLRLSASLPATSPTQGSSSMAGGLSAHLVLTEPTSSIPFRMVAHVVSARASMTATVPGGVNSAAAVSLFADLAFDFGTPLGGRASETMGSNELIVTTVPALGTPEANDRDVDFSGVFEPLSGQFKPGDYELFFGVNAGATCGNLAPDMCTGEAIADVVIQSISFG